MRASSIVVAAVFAALTFALWAWLNRPSPEPPWPDRVQGMAFSPFGSGQDPVPQTLPSAEQIDADLRLLAGKVTAVRTYSSLKSLGQIADIAARHQLKVALGAWLDRQLTTNEAEIAAAIDIANRHPNVIRLRDRQRGDPAQRSQRRRTVPSARSRARGGRATREHRRAVARVDQEPATGRARRLHRRAHAAVLGRHSGRTGGRLSRDARRATGARVSRQADRHRRSRLALRRPHARGRGRVDQQRGDVPATLPATRARTRATSTTSWKRSISPGRRATKARSARTGACTTSTASRSSHSSSPSCASRSGKRSPRFRWCSHRCCSLCSSCTAERSTRAAAVCWRSSSTP